ncbi:MAG: Wzz/FepE/Etk N-terminal domain-containing protein [Lewinella sp.]
MHLSRNSTSAPPDNLLGVLRTLWRWRKPIVLTTVVGAILAVIVSLLLPVYYTGYTSFVALSPEQISIESTFGNNGQRVQFYGTGDDIDRLLSVAESNEVIDYLVDTFNLYGVYEIDSTSTKGPVRVAEELLSHFDIERNPRDVIELTIEDKDPVRAANMARAARQRVDAINLALIRSTHRRNAAGLLREVEDGQRRLDDLNQRLSQIRQESGVYNTETQSEVLATSSSSLDQRIALTEARLEEFRTRGTRDSITKLTVDLSGLQRSREAIDGQLERLNASIGSIDNMQEERLRTNDELTQSRTRLKQYETILAGDRSTLEVIEEASVPLVKSSPIRWLIVVGVTVLSFVLAVVGALLIDSGRRYDWGRITS